MSDRTPGIRPQASLWRRLDIAARHGFPAASTLVLMFLATAPFGLPDQAAWLPAIALSCVFFWSLFRPPAMAPPAVFVIGSLLDLLSYLPLGVGVLALLMAHGMVLPTRRFLARQGFLLVWFGFLAVALLAAVLIWLLASILTFRLLPFGPALFQFALAGAIYPVLTVLLMRAHRTIADPDLA